MLNYIVTHTVLHWNTGLNIAGSKKGSLNLKNNKNKSENTFIFSHIIELTTSWSQHLCNQFLKKICNFGLNGELCLYYNRSSSGKPLSSFLRLLTLTSHHPNSVHISSRCSNSTKPWITTWKVQTIITITCPCTC